MRRAFSAVRRVRDASMRRAFMSQAAVRRVRALGEHASIEVSPHTVDHFIDTIEAYRGVDDALHARRNVFVNMRHPSADGFAGVERAVSLLHEYGHNAIPHVPASCFESRAQATHVVDRLARCGAREALLLGGNQQPKLDSTILAEICQSRLDSVAFCAFPDGHPKTVDGDSVLKKKLQNFKEAKVVTQWTSSPHTTSQWLGRFLRDNPDAHVYVSVCGPASRSKVRQFADVCGVPVLETHDHDCFAHSRDAVLSLAADLEYYDVPLHRVRAHLVAINLGRCIDFLHRLTAGHDVTAKSNLLAA